MGAAIYPGTFDPITYGHLDLIDRAVKVFDHLVVVVGVNPQKKPLFPAEERVEMIREVTRCYPEVEISQSIGLMVHYCQQRGIYTIVRSLRSSTEYELELAIAVANRQQDPRVETLYLMPSVKYTFLSSTIVREIAQFGGDLTSYVPPVIEERLRSRFPLQTLE